jgi:hypothetical protein
MSKMKQYDRVTMAVCRFLFKYENRDLCTMVKPSTLEEATKNKYLNDFLFHNIVKRLVVDIFTALEEK